MRQCLKYGKAIQAINDKIIWRKKDAIFVPDNSGWHPEFFVAGRGLIQLHLDAHKYNYTLHDSLA
jgi:hypothetical protein